MLECTDEYLSHILFPAYLSEEQMGYVVICGSAMAFNHTNHTALA